ncbi:penicillin acylase family protein [Arenibaculum sp.]|uniref:penicillin acylase family protein n=1 Tax=Arenibaculum sp. TaxID=2865862 RepID=UPI002E105614|nr:penicillin acylase family protein [Arenibaculum sp.]
MPPTRTILGFGMLGAFLEARRRMAPRRPVGLAWRLRAVPCAGAPVGSPVHIRWNDRHVPHVEAGSDRDLAVGLGVVHAHLRLAQMETMRRAARGRFAEILGPAAVDLDHVLRILDIPRAVPGIRAAMPEETRVWLEGFRDGVNHAIARAAVLPEEFALLAFRPEPWTLEDLVAIGRLAATDFTWKVWIPLLRLSGRPDWMKVWQQLAGDEAIPVPSLAGGGMPGPWDPGVLGAFARTGSNSFAVSARRSDAGSALIASDPHLSVVLPNLWLVCGMRSPGYHAVGLMVPGIPAVALGRNPWIAWGGTSLHAASSDLFDVGGLADAEIRVRRETIRVRWWRDREIEVRETEYGPVITDAPLLGAPAGRRLALHWVGHRPTDEMTALLRVNRARDWDEFRAALDGFAVPAQNMVYADARGRVGQAMAAMLPRRPPGTPAEFFTGREAKRHWDRLVTSADLPAVLDPERGFVASANNRPELPAEVLVSHFFSPDDRVRRLRTLLGGEGKVTARRLMEIQRDVLQPGAAILRDRLLASVDLAAVRARHGDFVAALQGWDGSYDAGSNGALAFELLLHHFIHELNGREDAAIYSASWEPRTLVHGDFAANPPERVAAAVATALDRAAEKFARHGRWGDVHRLRLSHVLGAMPVVGRRFRFADLPTGGGNETVMKMAHGFAAGPHAVHLGAVARHVSDMADPDANHFVLLGGNDGWIAADGFLDQVDLWREGRYVRLPLSEQAVLAEFPHVTTLRPGED